MSEMTPQTSTGEPTAATSPPSWPTPWWGATEDQLRMLLEYVIVLGERLGVSEWDIRIKLDGGPDDPDSLAQIAPIYGRKVASLRLRPDLLERYAGHEVVNTLTHELLHLVTNSVAQVIRTDLTAFGGLAQREYDGLWHYYAREVELLVDHLASILAPTMPKPPWASGQREASDRYVDLEEHTIMAAEGPQEHQGPPSA